MSTKQNERFVPFTLTPSDRASALWQRLEEYWARRLETLHTENENTHLDPKVDAVQTALRRGHIKAFREMLHLGKPPQSEELPPGSR
jgi:hypothetical protein